MTFDKEKAIRAWMEFENQYPSFDRNPLCRCYPNSLRATLCMTGHMLECHYPKTCQEANCGHYRRAIAAEEEW